MRIISKNPEQTEDVAIKILRKIMALPEPKEAVVLALSGDLGAGKTTFSQFLGKRLGVKNTMQSPTFLLIKRYETFNPFFENFFHIDAYRIEKEDEIAKLGFDKITKNHKNIVVIEWPEKIQNILPSDALQINFRHGNDENERIIEIPDELY